MRTVFSRLLLVALVGVGIFAIVRLAGGSHPADVVHLDGLDVEELEHRSFEVGARGARVAVEVAGSFEGQDGAVAADSSLAAGEPPLAAYGWLVRRETGEVAWRPRPRRRPAHGSVFVVRDTLDLEPGIYDAYFTSYGDPLVRSVGSSSERLSDRVRTALSRGGRAWLGEADRWRFVVSGATDADRRALEDRDDAVPDAEASVWASGAVGSSETVERVLRVEAEARVRVRVTTEITDGVVADSASIVRLDDGAAVWALGPAGGRWAGGSLKNLAFDTTLALAPGLYRVRFATDRSHAARDWTANPPFDPSAWGVRVDAEAGAPVAVFDPSAADLSGLPEIARIDCVGPNRDEHLPFTLAAPTTVLIAAAGEMSSADSRYDYATLYRQDGGAPEAVWEMTYEASEHAGGVDRNRRETTVRTLAAGRYDLRYQTDGSHDCEGGYGNEGPDDPLWGAVVAALSPGFTPLDPPLARSRENRLRGLDDEDADRSGGDGDGRVLVRLTGLGPDADARAQFTLDAPGAVRIRALGELLPSERLDWGWIETDDGVPAWTMTRGNTRPAGGSPKNRRFDGVELLPAGTYTVRFRTNDRHDATGFDGGAPRDPSAWGILVETAEVPNE